MSEKVKTKNGRISFALVLAGLMFFFNPCVNLFDVIPDMFGALLIYIGLRKTAVVDGYFEDARKLSFYLIFLYLAKFAFSFTVLSNSDNALPYTFIFSVAELIFLIPFFHKLFAGFEYTVMRSSEDRKGVRTNEPYAFSMIFVIVKCVGVVLVELFELITQGGDYDLSANAAYYANIAGMKKYAILLCLIVQLILGVIFIIQMIKFFKSVQRHTEYREELYGKYIDEISVNRPKHINKTLSSSYTLMIAAVVFVADMLLDGFDLLPDVVTAFFMILSMYVMTYAGEYIRFPKAAGVFLAVSGIACTVFYSYVNPERFYILAKERSMFENHSNGFFKSGNSVMITACFGFVFAAAFIYALSKWISCNRKIFEKELMGNHDRKLLTVSVLTSAAVVLKGVCATVEAYTSHIATRESVSLFISDRAFLTEQRMNERIASDESIALFTKLEGVSFVLSFFAIAFVVFAVFNIFALKAEAVKEDK